MHASFREFAARVYSIAASEPAAWMIRQASAPANAEDAYVIRRLSLCLAEIYVALVGDVHPDNVAEVFSSLPDAARTLALELQLHRSLAHSQSICALPVEPTDEILTIIGGYPWNYQGNVNKEDVLRRYTALVRHLKTAHHAEATVDSQPAFDAHHDKDRHD
jgi:hypothetical protein